MAKILLINPVVRQEDKPKHIPYGIALLAAIAVDKGHQVQIYDANAWRLGDEVLAEVCRADDWDVIGIGGLITTYNFVKKTVALCKQHSPKSFVIGGGGFFTCMPREMMEWLPQIDLGVVGEAFVTWPEVLAKIDRKDFDFSQTLGVCYRDANGEGTLTSTRPNISDLDVLPYPAWDLLPLSVYFSNSKELYSETNYTSKRRIDVNGSFGCNLVCRYCWHLGTTGDMVIQKNEKDGKNDVVFSYGRNIRYHTPTYIVTMVKTLVEKYDIDFASFIDENFMTMDLYSGRVWLKELSQAWIDAGLQPTCCRDGVPHDERCRGVHWGGTSHAALAQKETLEAMYKAGCSQLVYGIESFDPVVLKNLGKASTQKHNIESLEVCMSTGIIPVPNIIIGFPEDTFEGIRETIQCLIKLGIHAKPHFATPYPGSEWYYKYKDDIVRQYDGDLEAFIKDLGDASKITTIISHNFSPVELLGLQQIVMMRDLKRLAQSEQHWKRNRMPEEECEPFVRPQESVNFVRKKLKAPIEGEETEPRAATPAAAQPSFVGSPI